MSAAGEGQVKAVRQREVGVLSCVAENTPMLITFSSEVKSMLILLTKLLSLHRRPAS